MDFGGGDKGADAAAALDETFLFECGKGVACGHETDLMQFGEVALGGDRVARAKLASVNAFSNGALDALVGGHSRTRFLGHAKLLAVHLGQIETQTVLRKRRTACFWKDCITMSYIAEMSSFFQY